MNPVGVIDTREDYLDFAARQTADSPTFHAWARGVADDPEVLALIDSLPAPKRQPNLVLAAARWHGALPGPYAALREVLVGQWDAVRSTVLARATQTNEVGRCATLLPVLASLPGPLALLEVGASAGLCLQPDRYSYRFTGDRTAALDPIDGPSPVVLRCQVLGDAPLPTTLPEVGWRAGIDLHPLDVRDEDAVQWLETLVWPEHHDRRVRLRAAVEVARRDPPTLVAGDLLEQLPDLVASVPDDLTLVVLHSAVVAYLSTEARDRFGELVGQLTSAVGGHWLSNEGPRVLPGLAATAVGPPDPALGPAPFVLALDGRAVGWTQGHGRALQWLGSPSDL